MANSPRNIRHLVLPTCLPVCAPLAPLFNVLPCQSKSPLVKCEYRNALLSNLWVEVGIPPDVFRKAMDKDYNSFWLGVIRNIRSSVELSFGRTLEPGFSVCCRHASVQTMAVSPKGRLGVIYRVIA